MLTEAVLRPLLEELHRTRPDEPLIGVQLAGAWSGGREISVGGEPRPIRPCASTMDVRAASVEQEALGTPLVILTALSDRDLGLDLTARLAGQRLLRPSPARAVMQLFDAHDLDRRIAREEWFLLALLDNLPPQGYAPAPSGALTEEQAWEELLRGAFGFPGAAPTLNELLIWTRDERYLGRLRMADVRLRDGVRERLSVIPGAALLLSIAETVDSPADVLATIATIGVLASAPHTPELLLAAGRLSERMLGGRALDLERDAPALLRATTVFIAEPRHGAGRASWQERAAELVADLGIGEFVASSDLLDTAWSARLATFADQLVANVDSTTDPAELDQAEEAVRGHVRASSVPQVLRALVAARALLRWLHQPSSSPPAALSEAINREVRDGCWVVRARSALDGSGEPQLAHAIQVLATAVDTRRSMSAVEFATAAVRWDGEPTPALIGVEHVLDKIVAPVAAAAPTLVIVLDGLSLAVARDLLEDLAAEGWIDRRPAAIGERPVALAVLPSLTMRSRASLLCGRLATGGQTDEAAGFAGHVGLRQAGTSHGNPMLFHKRALSDDGATLSSSVRDEIFSERRIVGMVINAVDDELGGAVQRHAAWALHEMPLFDAALSAARDAGRAVVLLSDHGHIPERAGTHRVPSSAGAGDRHRPSAGPPLIAGEILADGRRVLGVPEGVILAADPDIRYTAASKPGYHGGASPEELLAPIVILTAFDDDLPGLVDQEPDEPAWWRLESAHEAAESSAVIAPSGRAPERPRTVAPGQQTMFDVEPDGSGGPRRDAVSPSGVDPGPDWVQLLLSSSEFSARRERGGRGAPSKDRIRALLVTLARHDGRLSPAALAAGSGVPSGRLDGLLAALRPLLNVEGYPILTTDREADLVELRIADLRRQFGI